MRWISTLATVLACGACQPLPDATTGATATGQPQPAQNQAQASCRGFTAPVTAAGQPEEASGRACRQPDGSWHVVQNTPGLPSQEYLVPRPDQTANAASADAPPSAAPTAGAPQPAAQPSCSSYTVPVTVGGQQQQAVVEACQQADGSWRITQSTPGLPPQVYEVPPPTYSPYVYPYPAEYGYPDFFPYWAGAPWFFGLAPSIVVVQRFNHFHHFFGFAHAFGHGFAAARGSGAGVGHR